MGVTAGDIILLALLLLGSAFFSSAETALTGINRLRLRSAAENGNQRAALVEELKTKPQRLLITILVGNNIVNIAASALFTALMLAAFGPGRAITIATVVMTTLILIFGEIAPKSIASHHPERVSYRLAKAIRILMWLLAPLVYVLTLLSGLLVRVFGDPHRTPEEVTEDEIKTLVNVGEEQGVIEDTESRMIHSVLELTDTPVRNVMVPRTAVTSIEVKETYEDVIEIIRQDRYSRLPVYEGDIDNIIGLLHAKDVCSLTDEEKITFNIRDHLRPTIYVFETKKSGLVLRELQKHRVYMAIIIDEYGGTAGLVTMEDLIEEIVGEIVDEYDIEDPPVEVLDEHTTFFDARLTVNEVNEELDLELPTDSAETIGGLVYELIGRIPEAGEAITVGNVILTVDKMDRRSIERVKVKVRN